MVALGLALRARGHRVTVLTHPLFAAPVEHSGLAYLPVGSVELARAAIADPRLWHARHGFTYVLELLVPAIEAIYRLIERHAGPDCVVAATTLALGARVAQERLGVPTATVHLQPSVLRSRAHPGRVGSLPLSLAPRPLRGGLYWLLDRLVIDRALGAPLNALRARLGLAPVRRVFDRWMHSPECVIGFFPPWFAAPQPDWPAHTHLVGFPLWDGQADDVLWQRVQAFLEAGEPPIVITPGSAAATRQRYFQESLEAIVSLGARTVMVTNYPEQLPRVLPASVLASSYLPFSRLLPRAALLVHHGGIGTCAQALAAGIPQLIAPMGFDQFDNAERLQRLGVAHCLPHSRYRARPLAVRLRALLQDGELRARCQRYRSRIHSDAALTSACELIETLPGPNPASVLNS